MRVVKLFIYYILGLIGIMLVSVAPSSMGRGGMLEIVPLFQELMLFIENLFKAETWIYQLESYRENIITFLWDPYMYSMKILLGAIIIGFFIAFVLAIITLYLPKLVVAFIQRIMNIFEAIPDLMFAFMIQLLIVYIYKQTGILVMEFTTFDEKIVALPMFVLAVLPTVSFYKIVLMYFEEEKREQYVEFAKSKGVKFSGVIFKHIIRNMAPNALFHSKIIIWAALSSLFVVEWIFNIQGIMYYIYAGFRPMVIAMALFYVFTPFFFIFSIAEMFTNQRIEGAGVVKKRKGGMKEKVKGMISALEYALHPLVHSKLEIHKWGKGTANSLIPYFKNMKFLIGFLFLLGLVLMSFYQSYVVEDTVSQLRYTYNEDGTLKGGPPHPPSEEQPFGSDRLGFSIFDQILVGAKYTIIFATIIALLRIVIGAVIAIPYAFLIKGKFKRFIDKVVDSMHFIPLTVIAYLLLYPVLWKGPNGWGYSEVERIAYQIVLLTVLVVPLIAVLVGNEVKMLFQKEYMISARTMGGDWLHIVKTHIMPHMAPRLGVLFGQQFIQVLLIFVHLGLFKLYFGGTQVFYGPIKTPPTSATYEWSGLVSGMKNEMMTTKWWIVYPVFIAFVLSIIAMQIMLQGMKEVQQYRIGVGIPNMKKFRRKKREKPEQKQSSKQEAFTFVHGGNTSQHL
ncbi:ABC transporter permease subunit [Pontibacillus sp. HMF3514]|uniref:ABC transporter permease subunit n=1 Tax=Pontibacillus sp. HMF3514 TaxID=2692425 RepID=UPI00132008BD|nr:ABC transporter permease subunit [Pontibacillus sp. HMF3514]QHE53872.1 ABC transporter permease subunit [Pontibacillus sp. HMF3514]